MDKETKKVMSDGEELSLFIKGRAWEIIRTKMMDRILNLNDMTTLPDSENLDREIYARKQTIKTIIDIIEDIKGTAEQHRNHEDILKKMMKDDIVLRIEEEG